MWQHSDLGSLSLLAFCLIVIGGCSTYEVRDSYVPLENGLGVLNFKQEDAELQIGMNPDMRFYSIGLLGVPFIPTSFKGNESKSIRMEIRMTLRQDRDFSFAQRPCLTTENEQALCPNETSVSAIALSQDDGSRYADKQKRWHHIANFYQAKERTFELTPSDAARISRQSVYQHYGYLGKPEFGYLQVNVRYTYKCSETCPPRVTLRTTGLVTLENLSLPAETIAFERKQQSDYRPMSIVQ
jgi:hypothetical protein